jgi:predicted O-methyltransferase YrrM
MEHICTHPDSGLTCIDPWPHQEIEDRFDHNTREHLRIRKVKGCSHVELRKLPWDGFDFAYIDGDHDAKAVLEDAIHCYRLVRDGGVIIFDDVGWKNPHGWPCDMLPKAAVNAFLDIFQHRLRIMHRGYQVFVRKQD